MQQAGVDLLLLYACGHKNRGLTMVFSILMKHECLKLSPLVLVGLLAVMGNGS